MQSTERRPRLPAAAAPYAALPTADGTFPPSARRALRPAVLSPRTHAGRLPAWETIESSRTCLLENPLLSRTAQPGEFCRICGFGINTHHRLGSGYAIANPRSVVKHQFQPVFAHHFADLVAEEFPWLRP